MASQNQDNQFDLKRILIEVWHYKFLFIFVGILAMGCWFLYYKFSSKTYGFTSTVLIKTKSDSYYSASTELMNIHDILGQEVILQNELNILQSTPHIKEVLTELGQQVTYFMQDAKIPKQIKFGLTDIYNAGPFMVIINNDHIQALNTLYNIQIINDTEFMLECRQDKKTWLYNYRTESFVFEIDGFEHAGVYKFGENVETEYFSFKLLLNSNYNPQSFQDYRLYFKLNDLNNLSVHYQRALGIRAPNPMEGSVATINFIGPNIQLSLDFLDGIIDKYIENNIAEKTHLASTTIQYIDRQLANISDTLNQAEQQLQNFRRVHNIMSVDDKSQMILNDREELEDEREEVSRRLNLLQQMKAYFDAAK